MSLALGNTVMGLRDFQQPTNPLLRRRPTTAAINPAATTPAAYPAPAGAGVTGQFGGSGDSMLDAIRNLVNGQANSRIGGARVAAAGSSPNDPSMSAFAGLSALLGGQTDAARTLGSTSLSWEQMLQGQDFQKEMQRRELAARLKYAQMAAGNPAAQFGGQVVGTGLGALLGGA